LDNDLRDELGVSRESGDAGRDVSPIGCKQWGRNARNPRLVADRVTSLQRMADKHNRLYSSRFLAAINRHISVDGYGSLRIARDRRLSVVQGDTNWPY
jgi:hypothetical protein